MMQWFLPYSEMNKPWVYIYQTLKNEVFMFYYQEYTLKDLLKMCNQQDNKR